LDAIVAVPKISNEKVRILQEIITAIRPEDPVFTSIRTSLGWPAAGFAVKDDSFYDSIRRALKFQEGR
jgi:hypothetical protein